MSVARLEYEAVMRRLEFEVDLMHTYHHTRVQYHHTRAQE